jgi:hypothetical protein
MLDGLDVGTGIDLAQVVRASSLIEPHLGHSLPSRHVQAVRRGNVRP